MCLAKIENGKVYVENFCSREMIYWWNFCNEASSGIADEFFLDKYLNFRIAWKLCLDSDIDVCFVNEIFAIVLLSAWVWRPFKWLYLNESWWLGSLRSFSMPCLPFQRLLCLFHINRTSPLLKTTQIHKEKPRKVATERFKSTFSLRDVGTKCARTLKISN